MKYGVFIVGTDPFPFPFGIRERQSCDACLRTRDCRQNHPGDIEFQSMKLRVMKCPAPAATVDRNVPQARSATVSMVDQFFSVA
jgi:hypothetical protein